jgi:glycosyltransferase involved in cell wall biosynthesis
MKKKLLHTLLKKFQTVSEIIIISNNSTDNTIKVATAAGATVLRKQERVWLCLLKRNGVHFEPRNKTRYCRVFRWRLF